MIIDIPTPADFHGAGLNQIYLAWQIAMQSLEDFDQALDYGAEDDEETRAEYWNRSQPALANAYSLIQQGMELALKGRIAAVSPLLLIGDPGDWPKRAASEDVSFGELRTLDAADLIKVHNSIASPSLDDQFKAFWEEVRRERNKIMHSARPKAFDPADVVRAILTAVDTLFSETRWPHRLLEMEEDGRLAAFGFSDDIQNNVMRQVEIALQHLTQSEAKRFFGFNKRRRAYVCPQCYYAANRDWQDVWPRLAQFASKSPRTTKLCCVVCGEHTQVSRVPCQNADCKSDVIADDLCLICTCSQEQCFEVPSGLTDTTLEPSDHTYEFVFGKGRVGSGGYFASDQQLLRDDESAKAHGEFAMCAAHLRYWDTVSIRHIKSIGLPLAARDDQILGHWMRSGDELIWMEGVAADRVELSPL